MAMNVSQGGNEDEGIVDINTTPLIDVMLVLLIMLIITIPIQTHAVKLDLPNGPASPPPTPPEVVTVDVDFDNSVLWNGNVVDDATLNSRLDAAAHAAVQPEIHLRPNRLAAYKTVVHVLAAAQRLGVTKLGLVGNEQFVDGN